MDTSTVVIGAGPAGLTAAYLLAREGVSVTVLEADPDYVGGISRTVTYRGFGFDIGGHRFFSKSQEVENLWDEILPHDMLVRPRSSRIYYRGQFFSYPLNAREAFVKLGPLESFLCGLSYLKARLFPTRDPRNFQEWVTNQFGERLFRIFFKTYTEKVWGMDCTEISADWAAQRIKGLSLLNAVLSSFVPGKPKGDVVKSLITSFRYPRKGPGMMWEECARKVGELGGKVLMGRRVKRCAFEGTKGWTITAEQRDGTTEEFRAGNLVTSAPLRLFTALVDPPVSAATEAAASKLRYRDFITVVLILKERNVLSDNWVYIHDPGVKVGRIQNFKSWSPEMVPDPALACYGLEYFCFEGDGLWTSADADLIELGRREIARLGIADPADFVDGCVVRQPKAYPVYDDEYARQVETIRAELESRFPTLHMVGRNGMHKYNNQDHSMMTAMLSARNILAGYRKYDIWQVNQDAEYHEGGSSSEESAGSTTGLRDVPRRAPRV